MTKNDSSRTNQLSMASRKFAVATWAAMLVLAVAAATAWAAPAPVAATPTATAPAAAKDAAIADDPLTSPRTAWFRDARFGMFIHWGIYAVPARGEWVMNNEKIPVAEYEKIAAEFNPVKFDAKEWVRVAKAAGMKYIVITSKHHDGFSMFDTKLTDYSIMKATPFKRDPMKELAAACKEAGIKFCFYYSIMDWHEAGPQPPGVEYNNKPIKDFPKYVTYMKGELKELVTQYGPLGILWFDGQWIPQWTAAEGKDLYAYVRGLQPDIIVNNRVGKGGRGDGDYETPEQTIPAGAIQGRLWETCMTLNGNWGFAKNDHNWKSATELTRKLIDISSKGGNFLLNVGPTAEGVIPPESVERLETVGAWMKKNGEAIYGTSAGPWKKTPFDGRATVKGNTLYLHVFKWPDGGLTVSGLKGRALSVDPIDKAVGAVTWKEVPAAEAPDTKFIKVDSANKLSDVEAWEVVPGSALTQTFPLKITAPAKPDPVATVIAIRFAESPAVASDAVAGAPVKQAADGSVALKAAEADLHGDTIQHEADKDAVGYWTSAADWVSWDVTIDKPGTFDVTLTSAVAPDSAGSDYVLSVAGQDLAGKTAATGGWSTFAPVKLGTVKIEKAGKVTLTVKAKSKPGLAVMNLRSVELKPAK
jgi:alpha-L-fucosidase